MRTFIVTALGLVFFFSKGQSTQGPNNPANFAINTFGSFSWTNSGFAFLSDNSYASVSYSNGQAGTTDIMLYRNFGFSIPANAIIDGLEVTVEFVATSNSFGTGGIVADQVVQLFNGTAIGDNKGEGALLPTIETVKTYGKPDTLWGTTLTPAIINSSNFGVLLQYGGAGFGAGVSAFIDAVAVKVYYTIPVSPGSVVINEAVTDPQQDWSSNNFNGIPGTGTVSAGVDEWVELLIKADGLDLTNWTLELNDATPTSGNLTSTGAFEIVNYLSTQGGTFNNTKTGDYVVLGNVQGSGSMNNSITLALKSPTAAIIDQVQIGGGGAPDGGSSDGNASSPSDEAIARVPNGTDTGNDSDDFTQQGATMGLPNTPVYLTISSNPSFSPVNSFPSYSLSNTNLLQYAFSLEAVNDVVVVDTLFINTVKLSGINGGDISSIQLFSDVNQNGTYEMGTDVDIPVYEPLNDISDGITTSGVSIFPATRQDLVLRISYNSLQKGNAAIFDLTGADVRTVAYSNSTLQPAIKTIASNPVFTHYYNFEQNDVVINEVNWVGSSCGLSENWIELKNNLDYAVTLGFFDTLQVDGTYIPLDGIQIPANGYALIESPNDNVVSNVNAAKISTLPLSTAGNRIEVLSQGFSVDLVDCSTGWFGGNPVGYFSMERINPEASGVASNFTTNIGFSAGLDCNGSSINGTPGAENSVVPGTVIVSLSDTLTNEDGLSVTLTVRLDRIPSDTVLISFTSIFQSDLTLSSQSLTFPPDATSLLDQILTISTPDDILFEGFEQEILTLSSASNDLKFTPQLVFFDFENQSFSGSLDILLSIGDNDCKPDISLFADEICSGSSADVFMLGDNIDPDLFPQYSWDFNEDGVFETVTTDPTASEFFPVSDTVTINAIIVQELACSTGQVSSFSDTASVQLIIYENAYAGLDESITICGSVQVNLFDSIPDGPTSGGIWLDPFGNTFSGILDPLTDSAGLYTYLVQSSANCSDTSYLLVSIFNGSEVIDLGPDTNTCAGANIVLADISNLFPGLIDIEYNGLDGCPVIISSGEAVVSCPLGTYRFEVVADFGCYTKRDTQSIVFDTIQEGGILLPAFSDNFYVFCRDSATLSAQLPAGFTGKWIIIPVTDTTGCQLTIVDENSTNTFIESNTTGCFASFYIAWKISDGTCTQVDSILIGGYCESVEELPFSSVISLFPNPADKQLNISLEVLPLKHSSIHISDVLGKELFHQTVNREDWSSGMSIDISDWFPGVYFVKVSSDGQVGLKRVVIE